MDDILSTSLDTEHAHQRIKNRIRHAGLHDSSFSQNRSGKNACIDAIMGSGIAMDQVVSIACDGSDVAPVSHEISGTSGRIRRGMGARLGIYEMNSRMYSSRVCTSWCRSPSKMTLPSRSIRNA